MRNASSINPTNMPIQTAPMSKRFVHLADLLYFLKFISSFVADNAKFQYDQFLKKQVVNEKDEFLSFDMRKQRVGVFLCDYLSINPNAESCGVYVNLYLSYIINRALQNEASALTRKYLMLTCRKTPLLVND